MTGSLTRTLRRAGFALAVVASLVSFSPTSSFAYTAEQAQIYKGDAFRPCSSEVPDIPTITACMIRHRSELVAVMDHGMARKSASVAVQLARHRALTSLLRRNLIAQGMTKGAVRCPDFSSFCRLC